MKITKIGHCCLILEMSGEMAGKTASGKTGSGETMSEKNGATMGGGANVKLMTDPGSFTIEAQEKMTGLDIILITHEHQDHFHVDSVKVLMAKNPQAVIVTNAAVGKLLAAQGIEHIQVGDGQSAEIKGVTIEGFGKDHAPIYQTMGRVENTGYLVAGKFYFPGDNFHVPTGKTVDVLALPTAGPWMKISEAIDFAKQIKARTAFGVHDGMIVPAFRGFVATILKMFIPETEYVALNDGETREF